MSEQGNKIEWTYTQMAKSVADSKKIYEELPFVSKERRYRGRKMIGRDSKINGGVYVCVDPSGNQLTEAVVVDDKVDGQLSKEYEFLLGVIKEESNRNGKEFRELALEMSFEYVKQRLPYDSEAVREIERKYGYGTNVGLEIFLKNKVGVCRHQALFLGYLIEKMVEDKYLRGKVSVDRNYDPDKGGHSWVRYVNSGKEIGILDPAQDFIGSLKGANELTYWDYRRPNEKK